ncbi:hypothetical protein AMATHDRAFT_66432 [Amanita thiersii Skay4041]|uniref:Uncharacterized protein n=1 Tax=Amanita thiersii Skay4041 TaxID=703135 RepID=A0A2A9NF72_9AGAR|nr:hypothetical protein AMATHDRAFT_66432 [Amanita thiersii Skay4041]
MLNVVVYGLLLGFQKFYATYITSCDVEAATNADGPNSSQRLFARTDTTHSVHICFDLRSHVSSWKVIQKLSTISLGAILAILLKANTTAVWIGYLELSMSYHSLILSLIALVFSSIFIAFFDGVGDNPVDQNIGRGDLNARFSWAFSTVFAVPAVSLAWSALIALICGIIVLNKKQQTPAIPTTEITNISTPVEFPIDLFSRVTLCSLLGSAGGLLIIVVRKLNSTGISLA